MAETVDKSTEIAQLEAILNAGTGLVTVDGQTIRYDLAEVRRRLTELRNEDTTQRARRPLAFGINLGGAL